MSNLSHTTLFSQHIKSRKLMLHIPFHQSNMDAKPPVSSNHHDTLDPYSSQSTFDTNVVIVLSLLVCGLICSIGVNFIVRCVLRCIRPPSAQIGKVGVEKKALKTFPILKYNKETKLPGLDTECVICLSEFKNGEKVRILPKCNHGFHVRCIDRWLGLHSTCPTCRNCLTETFQKIENSFPESTSETRETVLRITPLVQEGLECNRAPQ